MDWLAPPASKCKIPAEAPKESEIQYKPKMKFSEWRANIKDLRSQLSEETEDEHMAPDPDALLLADIEHSDCKINFDSAAIQTEYELIAGERVDVKGHCAGLLEELADQPLQPLADGLKIRRPAP